MLLPLHRWGQAAPRSQPAGSAPQWRVVGGAGLHPQGVGAESVLLAAVRHIAIQFASRIQLFFQRPFQRRQKRQYRGKNGLLALALSSRSTASSRQPQEASAGARPRWCPRFFMWPLLAPGSSSGTEHKTRVVLQGPRG